MKTITWHKPLLWLAIAMAALAGAVGIAAIFDHRVVTGVDVWIKPLKFAISVGVYSITLSLLIGMLGRWRRIAWVAGTIATLGLLIEMVIIVGVAATGETSHFNVSTPFHTALWGTMAFSIVVVWVMTFLVGLAFFRNRFGDAARNLAVRAGVLVAVVGMGLAFLMTSPTASQLANFKGIAGAHTVGIADGGPGLPLLGWSTVVGDLRIPHFVGMHALQVLPLFVLLLEVIGRHWAPLASVRTRVRLVCIAIATYVATLGVLTWQALSAQSIVHPSGAILLTAVVVTIAALLAAVIVLAGGSGSATRRLTTP
jgi:hypothetical protein